MIKMTEYARRRKELLQKTGPDSLVILNANPIVKRNHYHEYPYRQNSDFYYLTGFKEPEALMVLAPKRKEGEFILFNREKNRAQEIWDGYRAGQEGARKQWGADEAFPIQQLQKKLPDLLAGREKIYYAIGACPVFDKMILKALNTVRGKIRSGIEAPSALIDIAPILHEMRVFKSPAEIALMRRAAEISADAHRRAMQTCKPGMAEYQLEAEITHEFLRQGARAHAYTPIIGSGANTCILHYITNENTIKNGDMVLIDAGAEYDYYASDVTRSFPANGRFSGEQRAIYDIVLAAQLAGIKAIKPGTAWHRIDEIVVKIITRGLMDIGLLKGNLDNLIEKEAYQPFYMHRSGHWLGLDTHDAGRYKLNGKWRKLEPGMVRTVEPGIYISADIKGVSKRWHNIGVRIEDDIVVTKNGHDVLSHAAPKTIADIESLMAK
ncbi:MAG TPA: Xaa-Pro aminopeptidase [Gammaproteobacteria bacterium]|nr:Xaa-Pro aminopeptidase [Gammaproteobacteria bacterium]